MEAKKISPEFSVSSQISAADVADIASQGFRSIICNRPDGEVADQPAFHEISRAAGEAGLEARYIPVTSGGVSDGDAAAFADAMRALPKPVLAYCRSGTRSATLWSLSQAGNLPATEILAATGAAGYDMSRVVNRITSGGKTHSTTGNGAASQASGARK